MDTTHSKTKPADSLLEAMLSSLEPLVNTPNNNAPIQPDPYAALDPDSIFALTPQSTGNASLESPYIAVKPGDTFLTSSQKSPSPTKEQPLQSQQASTQQIAPTPAFADPKPFADPLVNDQTAQTPTAESAQIFPSPLKATEISSQSDSIPLRETADSSSLEDLLESKKRATSSKKKKSPVAWLIPLALIFTLFLLAVLIYGLFKIFGSTSTATASESSTTTSGESPAVMTPDVTSSTLGTAKPEKLTLQETAEGFLKASSWQDRLAYCRNPHGDLSEKMERYYRSKPYRSYEATINTRALRYENFTIIYLWDDENLPSDKLIIEKYEDEYLVDWEAFIVLQSMPWEDISRDRPTESQVIRARLKRLQNEHPTRTYAEGYICYDIIHPTRPDLTFKGYFKKPTEASTESNDGLYTISISCSADATDSREVIIDEFISKGWVIKK